MSYQLFKASTPEPRSPATAANLEPLPREIHDSYSEVYPAFPVEPGPRWV